MKRFIVFLTAVSLMSLGNAFMESYNQGTASFTATNEGPIQIKNTFPGTILLGVVVGTTTALGTLKIYDSSGAASNQLTSITLNTVGYYNFGVLISSGLTYTTANNTNGVTIIYRRSILP